MNPKCPKCLRLKIARHVETQLEAEPTLFSFRSNSSADVSSEQVRTRQLRRWLVGFHLQPPPTLAGHMTPCCEGANIASPDMMRDTPERISSSFRHVSASHLIFRFIPAVMFPLILSVGNPALPRKLPHQAGSYKIKTPPHMMRVTSLSKHLQT